VQAFLAKHHITQVCQPPYSLDLGPCDFWLFSKLKSKLKGRRVVNVTVTQFLRYSKWTDTFRTVLVILMNWWVYIYLFLLHSRQTNAKLFVTITWSGHICSAYLICDGDNSNGEHLPSMWHSNFYQEWPFPAPPPFFLYQAF
jgi:hypothetical protein